MLEFNLFQYAVRIRGPKGFTWEDSPKNQDTLKDMTVISITSSTDRNTVKRRKRIDQRKY